MDKNEILKGHFNFELHKKNFINYLEVLITPNGDILYANPSHSQRLMSYLNDTIGIEKTKELMESKAPIDIAEENGITLLWNMFSEGSSNNIQKIMMHILQEQGLYDGDIEPFKDLSLQDVFAGFGKTFTYSEILKEKYKDDEYIKHQMFYVEKSEDKFVINDAIYRIGSYIANDPFFDKSPEWLERIDSLSTKK